MMDGMDGMGGNMYMRLVYLAFDGGKITNSVTSLFHNNYIQSLCLLSLFQSVSRLLVLVSVAYPIGLTGQGHPDLDPYTQPCESCSSLPSAGFYPLLSFSHLSRNVALTRAKRPLALLTSFATTRLPCDN